MVKSRLTRWLESPMPTTPTLGLLVILFALVLLVGPAMAFWVAVLCWAIGTLTALGQGRK